MSDTYPFAGLLLLVAAVGVLALLSNRLTDRIDVRPDEGRRRRREGEGHWADYFRLAFHRTTRPTGYTYQDFAKITAPTLILVGDRDKFCTVNDAVAAFGKLKRAELAVLPGTGPVISPGKVDATVDFVERRPHQN